MADEVYSGVASAHRDLYVKFSFYLLAVTGAAVGFALNQTRGAVLAWSQIPLGLAMVSWSLSFNFGIRQLRNVLTTLHANMLLLAVQSDHDMPEWTNVPQASEILRERIEQHGKRAGRFHTWQVQALLIGMFFYVCWHVLEMYFRQPSSS